jgi:hypothetical protein
MKKFVVSSLVALMILGLGTMAFAQAKQEAPKLDFKASGFIDVVTEYYRNATAASLSTLSANSNFNRTNAYLETRARLKFDAVMGKNLSGTIFFELDSSRWGDRSDPSGTPIARNLVGQWNGDTAGLEIKNVYVDLGVPVIPIPVSVRFGLQPLSIRNTLLVYTDGMGITAGIKVDPANIQLLWFKALEGRDATADDVDVYGLHANAKISTVTVGGYALYYNMNTYPVAFVSTTYGISPSFKADMWWYGVYADGKVGPVNINFDFIISNGDVEKRGAYAPAPDVDYKGWVTRAKVDFPWEKFNFGVVGMYATGSDWKKVARDVDSYVVPPGSESGAIFGESLVFYSSWVNRGNTGIANTISGTSLSRGPVGGTWMGKLYASFKATPWYKVTLQGMYIGDTSKNGNTLYGNGALAPRKADGVTLKDDKEIGWEFDLINEVQIYKNLTYNIGAGFMTRGKALYHYNATTGCNEKPKTPWIVTSALTYNF